MAGVYDVGSLEIIIFGFSGFFCNSEIDYFVKASLFDDLAMVLMIFKGYLVFGSNTWVLGLDASDTL